LAGENGPILKIERSFVVKSFVAGMDFLNKCARFSLPFSAHVIALAALKAPLQTAA
jgi:pterin-4a-carbinolamine dehydratase